MRLNAMSTISAHCTRCRHHRLPDDHTADLFHFVKQSSNLNVHSDVHPPHPIVPIPRKISPALGAPGAQPPSPFQALDGHSKSSFFAPLNLSVDHIPLYQV